MMEAARILKAIGVAAAPHDPRAPCGAARKQGLLGSKAYVKEHFGTYENPKPEFATFAGYFNVDSGTGRIRGASVFGPPEAAAHPARRARARSRISASPGASATAQPQRSAAPTARRSTTPGCRASASRRTRSNTAPTRCTPTSTPTSASSRRTPGVGDRGGRRCLPAGHARRDAAAVHRNRDAARTAARAR